jgi:radical SAM protein with 4Fe4S-binding SPASM domain
MDNSFDVQVPWVIGDNTELTLSILDRRLLGSRDHFVRFDLYPLFAPSHLERHLGFWDLPLHNIDSERTKLAFDRGELVVKERLRRVRLKPVWKGNIPFRSYCMLHVSLWDNSETPPEQKAVKSSRHLIAPGDGELPLEQVYLPVTQLCNINCVICRRSVRRDLEQCHISPDVLEPILEASGNLCTVHAQGLGEPLLNDDIYEILAELKRRMPLQSTVGTCSNGTVLHREKVRRLFDTGIDYLYFSVDGATEKTSEAARPGSDFGEVVRNITFCAEHRSVSGRSKPWLMMNFVITEQNYREIPAYADLAVSMGVDSVRYNHFIDFGTRECRPLSEKVLSPLFQEAAAKADKYDLKLVLPRHRRNKDHGCSFMQSAIVLISGDVTPCCLTQPYASPLPLRAFGNIKELSLSEIWNSAEYKDFRHKVLTGDFPEECLKCDYKTGLMAG